MNSHNFRTTLPVLNRASPYKIKQLNLRHTRVGVFPLVPSQNRGNYLLPKRECLKYTKKFVFEINADSNKSHSRQVLNRVKAARPLNLKISTTGVYKIIEKLDIFASLNNTSNLLHLNFAIEGGLIEKTIAEIFNILLLKSPNLQFLTFDLKRCSLKPDAMNTILDGLMIQTSLMDLVFNVSSADIGNQEIIHVAEGMKSQIGNLHKLQSFIIALKANRRVTDEGINALADLVSNFQNLKTFKLDVVGTSVSARSLDLFLNSLKHNKSLGTFFLHASEISNICDVLADFFSIQPNLTHVCLDLSHDSQVDEATLHTIQTSVAKLPKLQTYRLNVDGCHSLGESGTLYEAESLSLFHKIKELEVHFASFLENGDKGHIALDSLVTSMAAFKQLESLSFDFSSCSDWFTESDSKIQDRFFGSFPLMTNLKKLSLNFKKSQVSPETFQVLLGSLHELEQLRSLELDLSFCKSIKEKDLRGILLHLCGSLKLVSLQIFADDINYDETKLANDLHIAVNSSETLKELSLSLKKTLMGRQAASLVTKFEPKHPHFDLAVKGGQAFTLIRPGTKNAFRPAVKSIFGK